MANIVLHRNMFPLAVFLTPAALKSTIIAGSAIVGAVIVAPVVAPAALGCIGFGAAGPIADSIAAAIQTGMGGTIAAGGLFATAQSVAMGGALPFVGSAIAGGVSAAAAAAAAAAIGAGAGAGAGTAAAATVATAATSTAGAGIAAGTVGAVAAAGAGAIAIGRKMRRISGKNAAPAKKDVDEDAEKDEDDKNP